MDRRTLYSVQAGLLFFVGSVILLAFRSHRQRRQDDGGKWFGTSLLAAGAGLLLQSERDIWSPWIAIILGNLIFQTFGPIANRGIARTTHQRDQFWWLLLLNVAMTLNFVYFTFAQPNLPMRVIEAAGCICVSYLSIAVLLFRSQEKTIRPATRTMGWLFVGHTIAQLLRLVMEAIFRLSVSDFFTWFGVIMISGVSLCYLWIDMLRVEDELNQSAMTDPLTGLLNRRGLSLVATRELQRAVRNHRPCSALMLDIDRFKQINDTLGHSAGDSALCAVAEALRSSLRVTDIPTRLGGDEFFVLLPDADQRVADLVVARIRTAIHQLNLRAAGGQIFTVSVSLGQITEQKPSLTIDDLLHASDIMLYRAKQHRDEQGSESIAHFDSSSFIHSSSS
jgi:diguanylate cyclase (GGDEF)-like protein